METDSEQDGGGRWERARRSRSSRPWLAAVLVIVIVPIVIGAAVMLVGGRGVAFEAIRRLTAHKFPDVQWIDRAEFARWREDPGRPQPLVLDARTSPEYRVSHLRDAVQMDATRPSLHPLAGRAKDISIVVYCSVGYRSARLAHWLAAQGYTNVRNLSGSLFQWVDEERPVFRDGRPTTEVHPYDRRWGLLLEPRYRAPVTDVETPFAAP